jgi:hypothetical protein
LEDVTLREKDMLYDYNKKKDTLKKLYAVHVEESARLKHLEVENTELKVHLERMNNESRGLNVNCLVDFDSRATSKEPWSKGTSSKIVSEISSLGTVQT